QSDVFDSAYADLRRVCRLCTARLCTMNRFYLYLLNSLGITCVSECGMIFHSQLRHASTLLLTVSMASLSSGETSQSERFDRLVARYYRSGFINGAVLVAEHNKVVYSKGFGYADMNRQTANTPEMKFDIASITKQFTAALVLQQVSEGRI